MLGVASSAHTRQRKSSCCRPQTRCTILSLTSLYSSFQSEHQVNEQLRELRTESRQATEISPLSVTAKVACAGKPVSAMRSEAELEHSWTELSVQLVHRMLSVKAVCYVGVERRDRPIFEKFKRLVSV